MSPTPEILKREGLSRESAERLARKAAEAAKYLGIHGVSVTAGTPRRPASEAPRPEVEKHFRELHLVRMGGTRAEMAEFVKAERERWEAIIRSADVRLE